MLPHVKTLCAECERETWQPFLVHREAFGDGTEMFGYHQTPKPPEDNTSKQGSNNTFFLSHRDTCIIDHK